MSPEVTVIIPNYNHAAYLKQRIDSVLNQTFQDFDVIILDDCSTDNSRNIIELYRGNPKVTNIIYNERNGGSPFLQWQKGIKLVESKYVWIAESDDYAMPELLEKLLVMAEANENVGISFCNCNWVNEKGEIGKSLSVNNESFFKVGNDEILRLLKGNTIQNASTVLMRTDLAKKYCKEMNGYKSCGDWIFYLNILKDGNICYTHEVLSNFRWYHSNTSNNALKRDLWTSEGAKILASLKTKKIRLTKSQLNKICFFWIKRIKQSTKLNVLMKIKAFVNVSMFYLKFLTF